MTIQAHEWIGMWKIEAPLTRAQQDEDAPLLEQAMKAFPDGVTIRELSVWINGRAYRWVNLDVTRMGT